MRIWSLHTRYLDTKGLTALWRETLLLQKVIRGETKGYQNHPQVERFRGSTNPEAAVEEYLWDVHDESDARGSNFNSGLIRPSKGTAELIPVTIGQVRYEWEHLSRKLEKRASNWLQPFPAHIDVNSIFRIVDGPIESWERT